ncbi:MAG TPA: septal ring lytic transglycosylase RlpA family protein [Deltaproteobacteria bacterium]|nr:septal ring lytic transglycosylase RlpA family protein [Deltaproteobacteria bacterium]
MKLKVIWRIDHSAILILVLLLFLSGCSHVSKQSSTWEQIGTASWYGRDFHGNPTASGEKYNMYGYSAAHKTLPLGTTVRVTHLANGRKIVLPINDRGPFVGDRIIDLSYGAARRLGMVEEGLAKVRVEVLKTPGTLTYGYVLQFGSYAERNNALHVANQIAMRGYTPSIEEVVVKGKSFHRVRLGEYPSLQQARGVAEKLHSEGFASVIIQL